MAALATTAGATTATLNPTDQAPTALRVSIPRAEPLAMTASTLTTRYAHA